MLVDRSAWREAEPHPSRCGVKTRLNGLVSWKNHDIEGHIASQAKVLRNCHTPVVWNTQRFRAFGHSEG